MENKKERKWTECDEKEMEEVVKHHSEEMKKPNWRELKQRNFPDHEIPYIRVKFGVVARRLAEKNLVVRQSLQHAREIKKSLIKEAAEKKSSPKSNALESHIKTLEKDVRELKKRVQKMLGRQTEKPAQKKPVPARIQTPQKTPKNPSSLGKPSSVRAYVSN